MPAASISFDAIGTHWEIETSTQLTGTILSAIHDCIEKFDVTYSRFRADSLVTRLSHSAGTYRFPNNVIPLIAFYRKLYDLTDGQVSPLIGSLLENAGYDAEYSFQMHQLEPIPEWDKAMKWVNETVTTALPITLDVGAAGKGYLIDKLASLLNEYNVVEYTIDASGDISYKGPATHVVGLEHPNDPEKVIGTVSINNQSICASATNRRKWGNGMHHIFDPKTKAPTREIIASWAIAKDAMTADGLATALFFADPKKLAEHFDFQYVRMHKNGGVEYSSNLKGELFI